MEEQISATDFLKWVNENPKKFEEFYHDYIQEWVEIAEEQDYFGTEGFNKRFA